MTERQQMLLEREKRKAMTEDDPTKPERATVMSDRWKSRSEQASEKTPETQSDSKGPDLRAELSRRRAQRMKGVIIRFKHPF